MYSEVCDIRLEASAHWCIHTGSADGQPDIGNLIDNSARRSSLALTCLNVLYEIESHRKQFCYLFVIQDAQLSRRDRAAGCVSFRQKWKTGTGSQYYMDYFTVWVKKVAP